MASPQMSKEYQEYATKYGSPEAPNLNIASIREYMKQRGEHNQSLLSNPPFDALNKPVEVTNTKIEFPEVPGHKFKLRVYRPRGHRGPPIPVILYFHGGYWCSGDANSEDFGCRAIIVRGCKIVIASFEHRLVPETDWRDVFLDADWKRHLKGLLIGGATSGAHLAAICAIRARNRYPDIKLTGQVLIVPTTIAWPDDAGIPEDWKRQLTSHAEMANAPVFNEDLYEFYVRTLGVPKEDARDWENFPVWADLKGLPPAYLPMDECDPIRDQGFLYAELLAEAGVKTRTDYYEGLPNMFVQFAELSTTLTAGIHLTAGVKWLLQERK